VKWEDDYEKKIKEMKDGDVIVLDNTRFQKEELENKSWEEHANDSFIKKIRSFRGFICSRRSECLS